MHAVGDAAYHGKALLVPATTITTRSPGQRRPLRAGAATHGQAVLEMVQERGDEWGVRYSICSSEGDTSGASAAPSAIAGVLIAARGPDAEALSGLASSAGHLLGSPL